MTGLAAVRAVLLDLDGTLLDTAPELEAATADMLAELGLHAVPAPVVRGFIGKGVPHLVRRALEASLGRVPDERRTGTGLESFFHHYGLRNGTLAIAYPGVRQGLEAVRNLGLPMACVTNKPARFTEPLLAASGLREFFSVVVSGDSTKSKKPAADPILAACERLDRAPAAALMVGDSVNDALSARAAGCMVVLVPYGYDGGVGVQSVDCDGIVPSLLHVAGFLRPQS